jgi:hypothetical protein
MSNKNIKIDDVFCSSWGFEQTNVDFYQVVGKVGKSTLKLREISKEKKLIHRMSGEAKPIKDSFLGDEFKRRVKNNSIKIDDYSYADIWDGKPQQFNCDY